MKLVQLKLKNFRQHADSTIDFQNGMTAIVGANGTGKSTILEAVTFALYGEQRDNRDTIRFYWAEDRGLSVALEFEFDGRRFVVERKPTDASLKELSLSSPQALLSLSGTTHDAPPTTHHDPPNTATSQYHNTEKVWAAGLRPVSEACERLMSLSYEQFKNSFCAEQKGLAFLQFSNKRARQEEVARMLGFHRLKAAEELAFQRRQTLAGQVQTLESTLGDPKEVQNAKEDAEMLHKATLLELTEAEKTKASLQGRLQASEDSYQRAQKWLNLTAQMREIGGTAEGLKVSVKLTKQDLDTAEIEAKELSDLTPKEAEYQETEERIKELLKQKEAEQQRSIQLTELDRLTQEACDLRSKALILDPSHTSHQSHSSHSEELAKTKERLAKVVADWQQAQLTAQARLSEAKAHLEQAQKASQKAEQAEKDGICPECGQPTGPAYAEVLQERKRQVFEQEYILDKALRLARQAGEKPAEIDQLEAQSKILDEQLQDLKSKIQNAEQFLAQAEEREKKAQGIVAKLGEQKPLYDPIEHQRLEANQTDLKPCHERYLRLQGAQDRHNQRKAAYDEALQNLEAARTKYKTLDSERRELEIESDQEATDKVTEHNGLLQDLSSANTRVTEKQAQIRLAEAALNAAIEKLQEMRKRQQELKTLKESHTLHDHAVKEMRKLRQTLNANIGPDLSARASENLSLLTNGRYDTLRLDSDFTAELVEDGVAKAVISGGEEDVVALALRLALSELIQERQGRPMSLLVLDEVFGSLDADRRQAVLDRLTSLKGRFQQILVISHIEEINQVADQCLYLTRDATTRATVVSDAPLLGIGELD